MKSILFFMLMFCGFSFAQQERTARIEKSDKIASYHQSGAYYFQLPENITADQVKKAADFYTKNFTVDFNDKKQELLITFVENNEINRKIAKRFFISLQIDRFQIDANTLTLDEFYDMHLK